MLMISQAFALIYTEGNFHAIVGPNKASWATDVYTATLFPTV